MSVGRVALAGAAMAITAGCSAILLGDGQSSSERPRAVDERKAAAVTTDRAVSRAVSSALAADDDVGSFSIAVSSSSGKVRLSGTVDSFEARDKAVALARGVDGVTGIDNQIRVNTRAR
ncbi:MAG: BON domain-containing protein [Gammaproteobacteria bacterium]|nr:BON domain-containing protein [Gammaproteobacteria bacterium]